MPSIPVYELIDEAQRRPSLLTGERRLPILVFTGDTAAADTAVETARSFKLRAPYAEINADETDITTIVERLAGENGSLTPWVKGTLLPPPRFPLTRFVLWAWSERETAVKEPKDPVAVRAALRESWSRRRRKGAFTGSALRVMADYVGRTMTTWLPATALATFGLQKLVDGVSLALWLASPVIAVVGALLHAALLIRGWLFYRWFRKAPYIRRRKGEDIIGYAVSVGCADQDAVERLLVTALLEDLRQAYQRRVLPWPGWGRNTYPVLALRNAEPGTTGRRFMELVDEVRVRDRRRGPVLLVASTSKPPAGHRFEPPEAEEPVKQYREWRRAFRRAGPSPYLVIPLRDAGPPRGDEPAGLLLARPLAFWAVVLALLVAPVTVTVMATAGCGAELQEVNRQCVGLGALDKMRPHPLVEPVANRVAEQNAQIPPGSKVVTIAYLGPLTTQPGASFKNGQMTAVAGELAGIGAYQASYNGSKSDWKLRVVFANTGQDFVSAELAATAIARRAREDPSLAAAVGFAWSRAEVKRAVGVLTKAGVPMVSTVTTVGGIAQMADGRRSAFLFRLAVVNDLQLRATIHWLDTIGLDRGVAKRPKVAVVWQKQDGELYSADLKELFMEQYGGETADFPFRDDASLGAAIRDACASGAEVIYYTGRADFLSSLKSVWGTSCEQPGVKLLASDDITGAIANQVRSNPAHHDVSMSFVSLTDVRESSLENQSQRTLRQWAGEPAGLISFAHAAFAYDAAQAVGIAFNAYRTQSDADDIPSGVHYNLRGLAFDGATGTVTFSPHPTDHDAQGREVWLMTVESGKPIQARWVCRPTATEAGCTTPPG